MSNACFPGRSVQQGRRPKNPTRLTRRRRKMVYRAVLAAVATAALAGCMTIGHRFDPDLVDTLRPGQSTMDDAIALLGKPTSTSSLGNSRTLLHWHYSQGPLVGGRVAHVAVIFDGADKMVRVTQKSGTAN